jgi:hypothetical protein
MNPVQLLSKAKVIESRIAYHTIKLQQKIREVEILYKFLTKIEAGKKSSVYNRELVHNPVYSKVLVRLLSLL